MTLRGLDLRNPARLPLRLAAVVSACFAVLLGVLVLRRAGAAVEYDWVESAVLATIHRVLDGESIYVRPTTDYCSFPYGPAYFYVAALAAKIGGEGFLTARLVSVLALGGTMALIGRMVFRETRSAMAACIALGVFASLFPLTRYSYDLARVDMLFVFLLMLTAHLARFHSGSTAGVVAAALAGSAALLTKQTGLLPVGALAAWMMVDRRRAGLTFLSVFLGVSGLAHLAWDQATDGWFGFALYTMPASHPRVWPLYLEFLRDELVLGLGIGLALTVDALRPAKGEDAARRTTLMFHWFLFLTLFVTALLPRVKVGGNSNNLIPLCAALALGSGLAAGKAVGRGGRRLPVVGALLLLFMLQHLYDPGRAVPTAAQREDAKADLAAFQALPAPVFAPCHPWLVTQAGKGSSAFWSTMIDAFMTEQERENRLWAGLKAGLLEKRWRAIVFYKAGYYGKHYFPAPQLEEAYRKAEPADFAARGWPEGPSMEVWLPRD